MYVNTIQPRTRVDSGSSRETRPARREEREFGETFEAVLTTDAVEVTSFEPDDERQKRNPNGKQKQEQSPEQESNVTAQPGGIRRPVLDIEA